VVNLCVFCRLDEPEAAPRCRSWPCSIKRWKQARVLLTLLYSSFVRHKDYTAFVALWCTVTVTDPDGRRHSLDILADSTYDAAHLFVVEAKKERAVGLPKPTLATVFEVVAGGKVYHVAGVALQRWIVERRQKWKGPKGYMFCQRPGVD